MCTRSLFGCSMSSRPQMQGLFALLLPSTKKSLHCTTAQHTIFLLTGKGGEGVHLAYRRAARHNVILSAIRCAARHTHTHTTQRCFEEWESSRHPMQTKSILPRNRPQGKQNHRDSQLYSLLSTQATTLRSGNPARYVGVTTQLSCRTSMPLGLAAVRSIGISVPPTRTGLSSSMSTTIFGYFSLSHR